jgi:hypothetical protein
LAEGKGIGRWQEEHTFAHSFSKFDHNVMIVGDTT